MDGEAAGDPVAASPGPQGSGAKSPAPQEEIMEGGPSRLSQAGPAQPAAQEQEALGGDAAPGATDAQNAQQDSQRAKSESSGHGAERARTRLGADSRAASTDGAQEGSQLGGGEQGATELATNAGTDAGESEPGINIVSPAAAGRMSGKADILKVEHSEDAGDHLAPNNLVDLAAESSDLLESAAQEAQPEGGGDGIAAVAINREGAGSRAKLPPEEEKVGCFP